MFSRDEATLKEINLIKKYDLSSVSFFLQNNHRNQESNDSPWYVNCGIFVPVFRKSCLKWKRIHIP
jgi:hypothetical protein